MILFLYILRIINHRKKLVSLVEIYLYSCLKVDFEITLNFIDWKVSIIGSFEKYTFFFPVSWSYLYRMFSVIYRLEHAVSLGQ